MAKSFAEKLKEADDQLNIYHDGYYDTEEDEEAIEWLVEQAERVPELERELKECYKQNENFSNQHWGLQETNERLTKENTLLKEEMELVKLMSGGIVNITNKKLRKRLEIKPKCLIKSEVAKV